jgi:hypothetical protein
MHRSTRLTIMPSLSGFRFDPASITTEWTEDVQAYEFRLRAESAVLGHAVNGTIQIFEGLLLRGEIALSVFVCEGQKPVGGPDGFAEERAAPYRTTFPSYSRKDERIVRAFEAVAEAGGDRFLRDVHVLRAGEEWRPTLLEYINKADVFQLFWSSVAAQSFEVEREWRHALTLLPAKPNLIRPVFWEPTPHPIPPELRPITFSRLDLQALGFADYVMHE